MIDSKKRKQATNANSVSPIWSQLITGAGLGLYFGWFFRPVRDPSFLVPVFLGLFITAMLVGWRLLRRNHRGETAVFIVKQIPLLFIKYAAVLTVLELRHFALAWGGRVAVILFTVTMGVLFALWFGYNEKR